MDRIYSVGQINTYIKNMFAKDYLLSRIQIKGEVSNCKYHTSGHIYFSLKDETGAMSCVMFARARRGLAFQMKDGDKVVVEGSVSVYERDGRYQMYAKSITLEGAGLLYERYLALKNELEEMGMFSTEYKQPIPKFVRRLGVVTAPTGAAIQDIRNISYRRNPYLQIILYPALVQGTGAKESIVRGIQMLDQLGVDVIIVGRGGGSIEDLWAFNEEEVARAIFNCQTPVISAVGHETDVTIADYVADLRAPTPSAGAELAVYDCSSLLSSLREYENRLHRSMKHRTVDFRERLSHYQTKIGYLSPQNQIREKRQYLMDLEEQMQKAMEQRQENMKLRRDMLCDLLRRGMEEQLGSARQNLGIYIERMKGLSPLDKLNQGFSYVTGQNANTITSISQVQVEDVLKVQVSDGDILAKVCQIESADRGE